MSEMADRQNFTTIGISKVGKVHTPEELMFFRSASSKARLQGVPYHVAHKHLWLLKPSLGGSRVSRIGHRNYYQAVRLKI
ncbi:hypothetical protein ACWF82_19445 [Nocardia sp. NPDC055053]